LYPCGDGFIVTILSPAESSKLESPWQLHRNDIVSHAARSLR